MNLTRLNPTEIAVIIGVAALLVAGIVAFLVHRKHGSERLRALSGGAEYARAPNQDGNRRDAEAKLDERTQRVEGFHVRPLAAADRSCFEESWSGAPARFVDGPAGAITEVDLLLGDMMSIRGYPVSNFEQPAADVSEDHPLVLENDRDAHEIAVRQVQASREELRQATVHYRTLFEELINERDEAAMKTSRSV